MMNDDRFTETLLEAAREYHHPPDTPREEIWAGIEAARWNRRMRQRRKSSTPWLRWGVGIAAILLLGIGLGRISMKQPGGPEIAGTPTSTVPSGQSTAYELVAVQHLSRTEALLTSFRAEARAGRADEAVGTGAQELLSNTRLLLDSPAAEDPQLRSLLQDLELVLVQISALPATRSGEDLELITEGLEQRNMLPRLRTAVPAGATMMGA